MPMPMPMGDETEDEFMQMCMADPTMMGDFPDEKQRKAVCQKQWEQNSARGRAPAVERRVFPVKELRVKRADGEPAHIVGHAAVFNQLSEMLGWFRERIAPGAFTEALAGDVRALWNHDPNHVLGRTVSRTLALAEDDIGLAIDIVPPDTQMARDLLVLIDRGDVSQMSFSFLTPRGGDSWTIENGEDIRTLTKVVLYDVSPVTFPAYPQTDVALRSREAWKRRQGQAWTPPFNLDLRRRRLHLAGLE